MATCGKLFLLLVSVIPLVCKAQNNVVPSFALSAEEAVKARKVAEALNSAEVATVRAKAAWTSFCESYQAAHSDLPGLRFTSDFAAAVVIQNANSSVLQATALPLSAEDRHSAETLHRAMLESWQVLERARKDWQYYQNQLVADHIPATGNGTIATLPNGKAVTLPGPWANGIAFTPDFRLAIPRSN